MTYIERNSACTSCAVTLRQACCEQAFDEAQPAAAVVLDALLAANLPPDVADALQQLTARDVQVCKCIDVHTHDSLHVLQGCCANPDAAETLRAAGSDAFSKQRVEDALVTYSQALQCTGMQRHTDATQWPPGALQAQRPVGVQQRSPTSCCATAACAGCASRHPTPLQLPPMQRKPSAGILKSPRCAQAQRACLKQPKHRRGTVWQLRTGRQAAQPRPWTL